MMGLRLLLVVVALVGCTRTFKAVAVQPNPLANQNETLRTSEKITIVRGDMELEMPDDPAPAQRASIVHNHRYPLLNEASFTMVSRDRLRFHVQVDHKWEEYADLNTWQVYLVDDKGRMWWPESVEHAHTHIITKMWDREQRTAVRNQYGDVVKINDDGFRRRQTLGSLSVFRGNADFTFYQRDLFSVNVRSLKLVVKRSGEAFEFTWRFQDSVASQ
ncbi:MAG TPA: hypothetical protein VMZ53_23955 [Kofleriaceae bacterium]|nr:hypothetical protein [Kofleriaceae bacterium]